MPTLNDYYSVLGVPRNATDEQVKRAFRKLAMEYHPDRNGDPGAHDRFKEINEAYEVLSDPQKRAYYDRYGRIPGGAQGMGGFDTFEFGGLGDIFEAFFGGATSTAQKRSPHKGSDIVAKINLSFEESYFGVARDVEITRIEICSVCKGIGCKPGSNPDRCPECNGTGQIKRMQQSIFGRFVHTSTCSMCNGQGTIITNPCPNCKGQGKERVKRKLNIKIPAGVDVDSQLRLQHEGEAGHYGGSPGDLYVRFEIKQHKFFVRRYSDIVIALPLNLAQAALGATVEVPTMEGPYTLKIPPGTQHGKVFHIKDRGFHKMNSRSRGDQLVVVKILTPDKLNQRQKQLLEELADTLPRTEEYLQPGDDLMQYIN